MVDNQHKQIKGYRDLSETEIKLMNTVKELSQVIGDMVEELKAIPSLDQRWVSEGKTDLQKGFMSLIRSIAQPTSF